MITSFSKILSDIFNIKVIFATIKLKNLMSIKAFKKSGFILNKKNKTMGYFFFKRKKISVRFKYWI